MLNKKNVKIIILILIISLFTMLIPNKVNAKEQTSEESSSFFTSVTSSADSFLNKAQEDSTINIDGKTITEMFKDLFEVFITAGLIIALVIIAILGIRFLLASAEGKAEIKENMTPYVIGCIVTFGAYAIWRVVISVLAPLG